MVASNRSESERSVIILLSVELSPSSILLRSVGAKEKKAISDALTNPDINSSIKVIIIAMTTPTEGVVRLMLLKICK